MRISKLYESLNQKKYRYFASLNQNIALTVRLAMLSDKLVNKLNQEMVNIAL